MLGFISDIHLEPIENNRTLAFNNFLEKASDRYEALYILGDLFEYWIGDDEDNLTISNIKKNLSRLADQGVSLFFIHGNRDFLIGNKFASDTNIKILDDMHIINLNNKKIMLSHGDAFCTDDTDYQKFKNETRNSSWIKSFLKKPLDERLFIADDMRSKSKSANSNKPENIMDTNPKAIEESVIKNEIDILIHGHTHRPEVKYFANGSVKVVLGSWEDKGWVFEYDSNHFDLRSFVI
ncbi:MAG: UDP-2,3-diacylglucosamine diphosphatase [Gammaproteobacteria bacterium]|jgi:UDP-2,3-diacylglucosamine hydrolase|uniref:UDP-2,3-diacylglucosamine hydrolase n=1 Tax=SAR86 cluster bacterium TaxID=2030880 RepID=A0A520MYI9_9GAMM|nr:UDP-2,3-diacylglucosamine diphosphatase [SAR86 cluster bacterium]RZO26269.1 MAG: UDP-2,3-diacylglucosamine diphosphatase [SAR86 cluster bacterium]|tara:strand:- start:79 stop:789 length:711 start_codon:yes stop_codon:yes gene_type:complete